MQISDHATDEDLPPDPGGQNDNRANWALAAVQEFQKATGADDGDAICDLLADLMHLCDRREAEMPDFESCLRRARMHYEDETSEEG